MERLLGLVIAGGCLAEKVVEECSAVIYMGTVQYLTHAQRVAIIQGNGPDYDIVPEDFDGPMTKKHEDIRFLEHYGPYCIATEWDGTKSPIHAVEAPDQGRYAIHPEMLITYQDGVQHRMSQADYRVLTGKYYNKIVHGLTTSAASIIMAADNANEIPYEDGDTIDF
jgi:hypothetical protein